METGMREDNETIGQRTTVGGRDFGREEEPREGNVRAGWSAAETVGEMETLGGDGRVLLAGRYRVARRLGEGGMGSVWLAEDEKLDGRKVAIKMLPSVLAGKKGAYRQVKAEALMAMKLSHSNIATVRAFEEDEGGNPFLVMDYIDGEGLDDILAERGPLGEEETLRLLGPVAAALDYAHSQGVVHRDVKPGNVMVRKDGTPFVLDFGIAREIQETMTRVTGKLSSGTLLYMSPEQLNGDAPKAAQDVYSFAAMAYECLTGAPPFARGQIEWQIVNKSPEGLPESVGEALRKGVMAGLAKEARGRPGSCAAVLGGKTGKNSESRSADSENRMADSEKVGGARKRGGWGWVAALAVAAGVGAGVWWWGGKDAGKATEDPAIAGEPPAAPVETRLEAASPEEEGTGAEVPVVQEVPETAQQAADEASAKLEEAAAEEDDGAKWQAEQEAINAARTSIDILQRHARDSAKGLEVYRKSPMGLSSHIEAAEAAAKELESVQMPTTGAEAAERIAAARTVSGKLMEEMGWLTQNKAARDAAAKVEEEIAFTLDGPLAEYEAAKWAAVKHRDGTKARKAGNDALAAGEFGTAEAKLREAKALLGEALGQAKAFRAKQRLESAKKYAKEQMWEQCLGMANEALEAEPGNAEAKKLKGEAEGNLKPSIVLKATVGGREVAARVTEGVAQSGRTTPLTVGLERGESYTFALEYEAGGKKYAGRKTVEAKEWGATEAMVALEERPAVREGTRAGERTTVRAGGREVALRWCPAGTFTMGSPAGLFREEFMRHDDETQHRVTLTLGFWMAETEVTQGLWKGVMGDNPAHFKYGDEYPVESVTWRWCQTFVQALNDRWPQDGMRWALPTEAQWEYACRAGSTGPYAGSGKLDEMGWYENNSGRQTHPVGQKKPNAWGLHDMHGNVWEWCADWYGAYPSGSVTDPTGPSQGSGRVQRGGSWLMFAHSCRSADRYYDYPDWDSYGSGLRVALLPVQ
jgi:formylglycine-generating enzyme required for sulfatase activity